MALYNSFCNFFHLLTSFEETLTRYSSFVLDCNIKRPISIDQVVSSNLSFEGRYYTNQLNRIISYSSLAQSFLKNWSKVLIIHFGSGFDFRIGLVPFLLSVSRVLMFFLYKQKKAFAFRNFKKVK